MLMSSNPHDILADVNFVRVLYVDLGGVIRTKVVYVAGEPRGASSTGFTTHMFRAGALEEPPKKFPSFVHEGIGCTPALLALPIQADVVVKDPFYTATGEIRLVPDMTRLVRWVQATMGFGTNAVVVGDFLKLDLKTPDPACPRGFLRRMIQKARDDYQLELRVGIEHEFVLRVKSDPTHPPVDQSVYASFNAIDAISPFLDELAATLRTMGINVDLLHAESAHGQFEVTWKYCPALEAADNAVLFRVCVQAIAAKSNMIVDFAPKPFANQAGSAMHAHLSLWNNGKNIFPDTAHSRATLSPQARHFVAGLLEHLDALIAVTLATPNSYRRLQAHCWAGAFQCWGEGNRETPIRLCAGGHVELKAMDHSCNPYLAIGLILAAGMDGIARQLPLCEPVNVDPADVEPPLRSLPLSLSASLEALAADQPLTAALGPHLSRLYASVKQSELAFFEGQSLEQEAAFLLNRL